MSTLASVSTADVRPRPGGGDEVQPWELHSELVLVSPEVCRRALEELPERSPYAFLARSPAHVAAPTDEAVARAAASLGAVVRYTLRRSGETARFGLLVVGVLVALASLAELLH